MFVLEKESRGNFEEDREVKWITQKKKYFSSSALGEMKLSQNKAESKSQGFRIFLFVSKRTTVSSNICCRISISTQNFGVSVD